MKSGRVLVLTPARFDDEVYRALAETHYLDAVIVCSEKVPVVDFRELDVITKASSAPWPPAEARDRRPPRYLGPRGRVAGLRRKRERMP